MRLIPRHHTSGIQARVPTLAERLKLHDPHLYAHSVRVSGLTVAFAAHLGFSPRDQRLLAQAAMLHDVGKLRIAASLLQKPTALDEQEWKLIHAHPALGRSLLEDEGITESVVLDVVQNHHERLDGTGYPAGISGTQVSEATRVITLCDVFAAMTETRHYGKPYTWQDALARMATKRTRLDLQFLHYFAGMVAAMHAPGLGQRSSVVAGPLHHKR
ncbi:HD-GYP domain-containing protein [Paracidobacterium acidisoli]|uniref:HD-GYP domain-containing protein n=1 Tax=Paracidobacterium acidisoli TaxID=2303751 RepID=UPI003314CC9F